MDEQTIAQTSLDSESLDRTITDAFTTPILSDSLDAVGLRDRVMIAGISPVQPGLRAIGRAQTVSFDPDPIDRPDPYRAAIDVIDSLLPGSVLVIETGGDQRSAYWGELFTAAAIGRGAAGIVTDGPTRDTPRVRALGHPVFGQGTRPIDFRARMSVTTVGATVLCGDVEVTPGDLVLADDDGIVVVPRRVESLVLARAVARVTAERSVLEELLGGATLREVWDRWGVL